MVRKESTDSQEFESCQLNTIDMNVDENKEEVSFIRSVVNGRAGWHEPKFILQRTVQARWFEFLHGGSRRRALSFFFVSMERFSVHSFFE